MATSVGLIDRFSAASGAFLSVWRNPANALSSDAQSTRVAMYDYVRSWDEGTVFMPNQPYRAYLQAQYRLYRYTRLLWNPIPNIINFWGGILYPGNLSADGLPFEGNVPTAVPFSDDISPELAKAMAQVMVWGNFQARKSQWARMGAMAGYTLMKIVDDIPARKIYLDPVQPQRVGAVQLNASGDVLMYAEQYKRRDSDSAASREYTYRREVDARQIRTYRDGELYSYDNVPAVIDHPYPFCPAVWTKFREASDGGVFGDGAIKSPWGTLGMLAEINSLESHIDDSVHKNVDTITVFFTDGDVTPIFNRTKRGPTDTLTPQDLDRESLPMLKAPPAASAQQLTSMLDLAGSAAYMTDKKAAFKMEYPEYEMYPQLRAMSQITGRAAEILLGDIANPVRDVRAQYDRQLVKALQMAVTMGGILAHNLWPSQGVMDTARQKFMPFNEDSYSQGKLDFEVMDRPLIPDAPLTPQEEVNTLDVKVSKLGVPKEQAWDEMGYTPQQVKKWQADEEKAKAERIAALPPAMQQQAQNPPNAPIATQQATQAQGQGQPAQLQAVQKAANEQ
jgi:hypothetical protein